MSTSGDDATDLPWSSVSPSAMAAMLAFATRQSHEESMSLRMNAKLPPLFDGRVHGLATRRQSMTGCR